MKIAKYFKLFSFKISNVDRYDSIVYNLNQNIIGLEKLAIFYVK